MTLHIDWVGLAEGAAQDIRGNMTLVGFSLQVLAVEGFPTTLAPQFVLVAEESEGGGEPSLAAGRTVTFRLQVTDPLGETVLLFDAPAQAVGERQWQDVPGRAMIVANLPFTATQAGAYEMDIAVRVMDGLRLVDSAEGARTFYVLDPSRRVRL